MEIHGILEWFIQDTWYDGCYWYVLHIHSSRLPFFLLKHVLPSFVRAKWHFLLVHFFSQQEAEEDASLSRMLIKETKNLIEKHFFLSISLMSLHFFLFLSFSFLLILSLPLKGFFVSVFYVSNRIAISNICDHRSDTWRKRLKEMKEMQLVKSLVKITIEKQRDTIWFSSHDSFLLLKQIPLRNSVTPGILLCPVRRGEGFVTEQQYTFQFKF